MNWAWGIELPPTLKLVLLKLADRANDDGECWPGNASIAKACCIGERTLIRYIAKLEEVGLVRTNRRYDDKGKRTTHSYTLDLDGLLSVNLAHGLSAKSCTNHVPTVAPTLNEETTIETTDATSKLAAPAPDPIVTEPVTWTGTAWVIDDAVFDQWLSAYANGRSHLDAEDWIEAELAKANLWLNANPRRRKKNLLRFLTGWLTRASESMNKPRYPQPQRRPYH